MSCRSDSECFNKLPRFLRHWHELCHTVATLHLCCEEELLFCLSHQPRAETRGHVKPINLEHKYGVVRFKDTPEGDREQELVFQTDDALEAMQQMKAMSAGNYSEYYYTIIVKEANH
jgi:hypothetical protein